MKRIRHLQVTCALYHKSLIKELHNAFKNEELSLNRWIAENPEGIAIIDPTQWRTWGSSETFTNLNSPDDVKLNLEAIESGHDMSDNS